MESLAVTKLNCSSLENICGWTIVFCDQSPLHRLLHWTGLAVTNQSAKTTKLPPQMICNIATVSTFTLRSYTAYIVIIV